MRKIRILVIDDAVMIRRIISDVLSKDPMLEVVGTAANGKIGLAKLAQLRPDVIIMDVDMPELDGLHTLRMLRKTHPSLPVIMFSTLTEHGAAALMEALALGASDYVTKPSAAGSLPIAAKRVEDELVPKIKALCSSLLVPANPALTRGRLSGAAIPPASPKPRSAVRHQFRRIEVLAIGVSTGGPNALADLIPALPADFPVPILIVQHMPPIFTRLLAERLEAKSSFRVREGATGEVVMPGQVWIAPGGYHMVVEREGGRIRLRTHQDPPENSCRPAVDVLFRSVVKVYGAGTLALVLTGMGQDGLRSCGAIREAGGQILAQDEPTSVVWGMPGFVAQAGLADRVLPLNQLAPEIVRRVSKRSAF
ncbi:MAG TPA: chemotaxis response regulator protein-glutamate methylesterase [Blastocatellia bacterium]|nr:chemotaxis response regulator protein-glutamate methylesterase [Blastocatellia bacterium]